MVVECEGVVHHWIGLIHNCPVGVKDCSTDLVMENGVYSTILHPLYHEEEDSQRVKTLVS
jgi:hypothetical protein